MSFLGHTCKECGGVCVTLSSIKMLLCSDCKRYYSWPLKAGQQSVLIHGERGGDEDDQS